MGAQMILAGFLAWMFRANKAVSVAVVWISNPGTMLPIYWYCYRIGSAVLALDPIGRDWWGELAHPPPGWWPTDDHTLTSIDFWPTATFALSLVTPQDEDRGILAQLAGIGVVRGERWDAMRLGADTVAAVEEGMDEAVSELMRASLGPAPPTGRTRADFDRVASRWDDVQTWLGPPDEVRVIVPLVLLTHFWIFWRLKVDGATTDR